MKHRDFPAPVPARRSTFWPINNVDATSNCQLFGMKGILPGQAFSISLHHLNFSPTGFSGAVINVALSMDVLVGSMVIIEENDNV